MAAARVLIVANPAAGAVTPALVSEVVEVCRRHVGDVSVCWTRVGDVAGASAVVAVGGDGTVREVASRGTPMLIVPAGTANSCYHSLFGRSPWQTVVAAALRSPAVRRLDLARVAGRLMFSGASAGFSAQAIHEARTPGPGRYHTALVNLIPRYRPYPGRVTVDGRVVHSGLTLLVNVGGSRYRGGHFELLPRSVPDDGLLDVCVLGGEHPAAEMMELTRTGAHLSRPGVVYERGRQVRIERTDGQPLWFEHDGEVLPRGPAEYTVDVVPAAVPVLVELAGAGFAVVDAGDAA